MTSLYRALAMLEGPYVPKLNGRAPYWRPPVAKIDRVHTPAGSWAAEVEAGTPLVDLDTNGAYLAAASSADFAHGGLAHTGPLQQSEGNPGYYLIDAHPWQLSPHIVSPLGPTELPDQVWVAEPILTLLQQLAGDGYWPQVTIHDSWTCHQSVRFRKWTDRISADRRAYLEALDADGTDEFAADMYESVKLGYSQAVQLMRGPAEGDPVKSAVRRPDWYDTIHAQHWASRWRKAWNCHLAGHPAVYIGAVDELTFTVDSFNHLMMSAKPPFRMDGTGIRLGAFKVKATRTAEAEEVTA